MHTTTPTAGSRTALMRAVLRFWALSGVVGVLLGGTLGVLADGRAPHGATGARRAGRAFTPGEVALNNLSAQIDGARVALQRHPQHHELRARLVGQLLERARFTAAASDLDEALALTLEASGPAARPAQWLLEAQTLGALHRFPEALARLDRAAAGGAPRDRVAQQRDVVLLAMGVRGPALAAVLARRAELARRAPTVGALVEHATALAAAGRLREADAQLARAQVLSPDVSPLPVAQVAFYRGVLAAEVVGDDAAAAAHYEEALRLVPRFVRAAVHLAELEAARGDRAAARQRLLRVLAAEDPEPAVRLAELSAGAERDVFAAAARARYGDLLARHRAAYLDHALEFALALEPRGARATTDMATELLAARPTARAYLLALDEAERRADHLRQCALARDARPLADTHPVLRAALGSVSCP